LVLITSRQKILTGRALVCIYFTWLLVGFSIAKLQFAVCHFQKGSIEKENYQ